MLTLPLGTAFIAGLSEPEIGLPLGDYNIALRMRVPTICTAFDHDASQTSFSGTVILSGFLYYEAFSTGSLVTTFSDTDEGDFQFTLTVDSEVYDTAAGTAEATLTGSFTEFQLDEWSVDTILATLDLELSLVGTTGVTGDIDGTIVLLPISTTVNLSSRPFSLTVGAACS